MSWEGEVKAVVWDRCVYCERDTTEVPPIGRFLSMIDGRYQPTCLDCGFKNFDGERMGVVLARRKSSGHVG